MWDKRVITDAMLLQRLGNDRLWLPNSAYCVDGNRPSHDFEIDPNPEHGFEIFNWLLISGPIQSVS